MCLAFPIAYARDIDDSGSLKNDRFHFQKDDPVGTSSLETETQAIYAKSQISTNVEI
jgi:hypothetical protein